MPITAKDIPKLNGVQKVAIVLLSLSEENATKVFECMSESEITEISHAMSHLGSVHAEVVDSIMSQLSYDLTNSSSFFGSAQSTERLLGKVLDKDRLASLMSDMQGPQGKNTWEKLSHVNEELLALYLRNEQPQTAALVLSKISSDHAAKVLGNLSDDFAFEIIARILRIGSVKREVLDRVEDILRAEFISSVGKTHKSDSIEMLAEIFNNLDRNSESKFMSMLESKLPDSAAKIKDKMFTFDDLAKIDVKGIQRLLRDVEKQRLALALKGATPALTQLIFGSMSQRAAKILEEDIMSLGAVKVKDVDAARADVVLVAKELIDSGEIDLPVGGEDDELIT